MPYQQSRWVLETHFISHVHEGPSTVTRVESRRLWLQRRWEAQVRWPLPAACGTSAAGSGMPASQPQGPPDPWSHLSQVLGPSPFTPTPHSAESLFGLFMGQLTLLGRSVAPRISPWPHLASSLSFPLKVPTCKAGAVFSLSAHSFVVSFRSNSFYRILLVIFTPYSCRQGFLVDPFPSSQCTPRPPAPVQVFFATFR